MIIKWTQANRDQDKSKRGFLGFPLPWHHTLACTHLNAALQTRINCKRKLGKTCICRNPLQDWNGESHFMGAILQKIFQEEIFIKEWKTRFARSDQQITQSIILHLKYSSSLHFSFQDCLECSEGVQREMQKPTVSQLSFYFSSWFL